jgi:hypothetical protein
VTRILLILIAASMTVACTRTTAPSEPFGARYRVMFEPDAPILTATTLSATVSYGGCRGNHRFVLRSRIGSGSAAVWLQKETPDESCDMLVTEPRSFELPASVGAATTVVLLSPDIEPYQLRP